MDSEIPGLKPTWVICFKDTDSKKRHVESCNSLGSQCNSIAEAAQRCADRAHQIQSELEHLEDVVQDFREFMRRFEQDFETDDPYQP